MTDRLSAQFAFLNEADRLKQVLRATTLCDGSRPENSGEHSWHLALYALVLADQAGPGVSIDRVIRMLLLHDIVEIDVGDVPIHSQNGAAHGSAETQAAEAAAASADEQRRFAGRSEQRTYREPGLDSRVRHASDRHAPRLAALARDIEQPVVAPHIADVQRHQL